MSKIKLKDYQQKILEDLDGLKARGLFMGTGSGKTYTSLAIDKTLGTQNLLIVCPAAIVDQWRNSVRDISPDYDIMRVLRSWTGKKINEELRTLNKNNNVIIVSMYVIHSLTHLEEILDPTWHIIFDESHRMKAHNTRVTKTMLRLGRYTPYKTILSATPTEADYGGYVDLYTQLTFLGYINMTRTAFLEEYTYQKPLYLPHVRFPIMEITGYRESVKYIDRILQKATRSYTPKYTDEPAQSIKITIHRCPKYNRMKRERHYENIDFSNPSRMRIAERTMTTGTVMGQDMYGERLTYDDNKLKMTWLEEFVKDQGKPILIYYQYNVELDNLEAMAKKLKKKYIVINGANQNKIDDIKNKEYDLILGQLDAASESIDGLQYKTNIAVYFALPESSIVARQSTGRIDRMGQEYAPKFYYMIMNGTIDDHIWKMVESKKAYSRETLEKLIVEGFENKD